MSEFSDSSHFRDASVEEVVAVARKAGALAIVLPEGDRWACAVGANVGPWDGVRVDYAFASDHECTLRLFEGRRQTGVIRILFEGQKQKRFDPEPWIRAGLIDDDGAQEIARWIRRGEFLDLGPRLAKLLGFRHYSWLSARDVFERWDEILERDAGAVGVDPAGTRRRAPEPESAVVVPSRSRSRLGLAELLVGEHFVTLAPGEDPGDLDDGMQAILRKHADGAKRAKELLRWLRAQKSVQRVNVDPVVLEGILEAF